MTGCWNCGQPPGESLYCSSCQALQPPPSGYFELLGLPLKLDISQEQLQTRFYELSRQLHPDRFVRKSQQERQYSLEASSVLNDAYRTLRDPVKRAEYVLKLRGVDEVEQRSKNVPPELLEEVFELNMVLEEIRSGDQSARVQLEQARKNFTQMLAEADARMQQLFAQYDAGMNPDVLLQIRGVLNRRKYIHNLVNEVSGALV